MKAQGCFYVLLPYSPPYFLKQDLSVNLELSILATLIDGEALVPTHLCLPSTRGADAHRQIWLLCGC